MMMNTENEIKMKNLMMMTQERKKKKKKEKGRKGRGGEGQGGTRSHENLWLSGNFRRKINVSTTKRNVLNFRPRCRPH
jgi:hypothetical protein